MAQYQKEGVPQQRCGGFARDISFDTIGAAIGEGVGILATGVLEVGKHTPMIAPLCNGLERIKGHWDENCRRRGRLLELHDRCRVLTMWVIIRYDEGALQLPITPLCECVESLRTLVIKYSRLSTRGKLFWNYDGKDIDQLGRRLDSLVTDMNFAVTMKTVEQVRRMAERILEKKNADHVSHHSEQNRLHKCLC